MTLPNEFFTFQSFSTLTGATGITVVVTNSLKNAFKINPAWLGLIVAIIISIMGVCLAGETGISNYVIGLLNGFLIFTTAAGANEAGSRKRLKTRDTPDHANEEDVYGVPEYAHHLENDEPVRKRAFFSSWFR